MFVISIITISAMVTGVRRHTHDSRFAPNSFQSASALSNLCVNEANEYFGQLHELIKSYPTIHSNFEMDEQENSDFKINEEEASANFQNQIQCGRKNLNLHCPSNTEDAVSVYHPNYQNCKLMAILLSRVHGDFLVTLILARSMFSKYFHPIITNFVLRTIASSIAISENTFMYILTILKRNAVELTRVAENLAFVIYFNKNIRASLWNRIKLIFEIKNYDVQNERRIAYNQKYECAQKSDTANYLRAFIFSMGQCELWVQNEDLSFEYKFSMWKKAVVYDYNNARNICHSARISIYSELNAFGAFTLHLLESGDSKKGLTELYAAVSVSRDFRYNLEYDIFLFHREALTPTLLDTYHRLIHSKHVILTSNNARELMEILDESLIFKKLIDPSEPGADINGFDLEISNRHKLKANKDVLKVYDNAVKFIRNDLGAFDNNGLLKQLQLILSNPTRKVTPVVRKDALKVLLEFRTPKLAEDALSSLKTKQNKELINSLLSKLNDFCFCGEDRGIVTMTPCCGSIIHPCCLAAVIENKLVSGEMHKCPFCRAEDFDDSLGRRFEE